MRKYLVTFMCLLVFMCQITPNCYASEVKNTTVGLDFTFTTEYSQLIQNENCYSPNIIFNNSPIKVRIDSNVKSEYKMIIEYYDQDKGEPVSNGFLYHNKSLNTMYSNLTGLFSYIERDDLYLPEIKFPDSFNIKPVKITLIDCNNISRQVEKDVLIINTKNWYRYTINFAYLQNGYNQNADVKYYNKKILIPKVNAIQDEINKQKLLEFTKFFGITLDDPEVINLNTNKNIYEVNEIMKVVMYTIDQSLYEGILKKEFTSLGIKTTKLADILSGGENPIFRTIKNLGTAIKYIDLAKNFMIFSSNICATQHGSINIVLAELSIADDATSRFHTITGGLFDYMQDECDQRWNSSLLKSQYIQQKNILGNKLISEDAQKKLSYIQYGGTPKYISDQQLPNIIKATQSLVEMEKSLYSLIYGI